MMRQAFRAIERETAVARQRHPAPFSQPHETARNVEETFEKARRRVAALGCLFVLTAFSGCGEPIYEAAASADGKSPLELTSAHEASFYEWPMTRDGYIIAKPPQMAFLTSFEEKLRCPDPVAAELVSWSTDGIAPSMQRMLENAYQPPQSRLAPVLTLPVSQLAGPSAFDVSSDGTRLVVVDAEGLALYDAKDGSLIGRKDLPPELRNAGSPATAVRFCGPGKDLLVASDDRVVRISSRDGSVIGQAAGTGEPIEQWLFAADGKSMLIRGESGKIFGGDSDLTVFSEYQFANESRFQTVSLSADGKLIGAVLDDKPRLYAQQGYRIVETIAQREITFGSDASVAIGATSKVWSDGDTLHASYEDANGNPASTSYTMFWKPLQMSIIPGEDGGTSYLTVGRRWAADKEQIVLFELYSVSRMHSHPQILNEVPTRVAHSRRADVVAIFDSQGLQLAHRPVWHPYAPIFVDGRTHDWVDEKKFAQLEALHSIIATQERLAFGTTSEELRTRILRAIAYRWLYLSENEPEGEILAALEQWYDSGSPIAAVARGLKHYQKAWNDRGSGMAGTVTQQGWESYQQHLDLAIADLDKVLEMDKPPLVAIETRIQAVLEIEGDLPAVDPLCRRACELYPGEASPHQVMTFKLLPRWFGEPGDSLSYALSASKLFDQPQGDFLYMRLVSRFTRFMDLNDQVGWRSFDSDRLRRGLQECIRRRANATSDLWDLWFQMLSRGNDNQGAESVLRYLMETTAAPSETASETYEQQFSTTIQDLADAIRQ